MSSDGPELREETNTPEEENQDELSLEQLSNAYAQVMREQGQPFDDDEFESDEEPAEVEEEADKANPNPTPARKQKSLEEIDAEDNAACAISPKSIVEAILLVGAPSGVKLTGRKIAAVMRDVSPKEVKKIVKELNKDYQSAGAAFRIVEESGDYKMKLSDDLADVQNHYFGRNRPAKLSQGAIDVLAIVAYNQPVTRKQVEKIRSRPSGSVLSQLVKRELVSLNADEKSKEKTFETTDRFLELFGLGSLEDLPQTSVVSDLEELTDA